jgi:hypothetical protein
LSVFSDTPLYTYFGLPPWIIPELKLELGQIGDAPFFGPF